MKIFFHKNFIKQYKKLKVGEKEKYNKRLLLFNANPFHPILNNHALYGKYLGHRSINITGDLRALYKIKNSSVIFYIIDTHSNLY